MKKFIPIVLMLILALSLCSCSGIDYPFAQPEDQIEALLIVNVWLGDNGELQEHQIKRFTEKDIISELISDLKNIKCTGIGNGEPVGLLENDTKSTVLKIEYTNGDIEYINYFGQASLIGGEFNYKATSGTFDKVKFNSIINGYISR